MWEDQIFDLEFLRVSALGSLCVVLINDYTIYSSKRNERESERTAHVMQRSRLLSGG